MRAQNEVSADKHAPDLEIVERVRRGDEQGAACLLFRRYARLVNHTVRRVLGPDPDHDDMVSEAFVRAVAALRNVREPRALGSWMITVTLNTVRHQLRERGRRRRLMVHPGDHDPPSPRTVDHEARALLARVFEILEQMKLEERLVFCLHYLDQRQTIPQIATHCGWSERTVKRRLAKARKHFVGRARREPDLAGWLEGSHLTKAESAQ